MAFTPTKMCQHIWSFLLATDLDDVVVITKRYASDTAASQSPVLVLPQAFLSRLGSRIPQTARPPRETPAARRQSWLDLAQILLDQPEAALTGDVMRSVQYLHMVGSGQYPPVSFEPLPWHETVQPALERYPNVESLRSFPVLLPVATFKAQLRG